MVMSIPAIETRYAGCRFRSRLEARWAVFFDALGLTWEYEAQGFETPHGPYLPDFRIACSRENEDLWIWVEIRGKRPDSRDLLREAWFANSVWNELYPSELFPFEFDAYGTESGYCILFGDIPRPGTRPARRDGDRELIPALVMASPRREGFRPDLADWRGPEGSLGYFDSQKQALDVRAALTRARSARFEHGEQG